METNKETHQYKIPAKLVLGGGLFFYVLGAFLVVYLGFLSIGKTYYDYHGDDAETVAACDTYEPERDIQTSYSSIDLIGKLIKNDEVLVEIQEEIGTCPYDIARVYRVVPILGYATGILGMGLGALLIKKYKQAESEEE